MRVTEPSQTPISFHASSRLVRPDKSHSTMNEYFVELRNLCRKIDGDIKTLEKTWNTPHRLISGCGDNFEETEPYVERFLGDIKYLQDQLIADREPRAKYLSDTEKDLSMVKTFCDEVTQDCEDVQTLLSCWGYKPVSDHSERLHSDESETESSILTSELMVDSSPCANSTQSSMTDVFFTPTVKVKSDQPKSIATPVIKSLASVMKLEAQNRSNVSSSLDRLSKGYLSPYYGREMK